MYRYAIQGTGDFHSAEAVMSNCLNCVSSAQGMSAKALLFLDEVICLDYKNFLNKKRTLLFYVAVCFLYR
jgi:hypothetical protein